MKIKIFLVILILFSAWFFWKKSDAVIIDNNYHFTHNNIDDLYDVEMKLAKIKGSSVVNSKIDVLYNLVITSMQKTILKNNGVTIDKNNAISFVEKTNPNFAGFYKDIEKHLGDDYYKLLIEPVVISETFVKFYQSVEPARQKALAALKIAGKGLEYIAKKSNKSIVKLNIDGKMLKKELIEKGSKIYKKVVKINGNFAIFRVNSINNNNAKIDAVMFKIVSYKNLLSQLTKEITVVFPFFSWYDNKDINNKKGSVLNEK